MTKPATIAVNSEAANADPHYVAPHLVRHDASGALHLVGGRCEKCGANSFPRAVVCASCLSEDIAAVDLPSRGKLYSYSIVHAAPAGWNTPYAIGYVDLPDDVRVLAHLDLPLGEIKIDMPMQLSAGVVGKDAYGVQLLSYTFKPV